MWSTALPGNWVWLTVVDWVWSTALREDWTWSTALSEGWVWLTVVDWVWSTALREDWTWSTALSEGWVWLVANGSSSLYQSALVSELVEGRDREDTDCDRTDRDGVVSNDSFPETELLVVLTGD